MFQKYAKMMLSFRRKKNHRLYVELRVKLLNSTATWNSCEQFKKKNSSTRTCPSFVYVCAWVWMLSCCFLFYYFYIFFHLMQYFRMLTRINVSIFFKFVRLSIYRLPSGAFAINWEINECDIIAFSVSFSFTSGICVFTYWFVRSLCHLYTLTYIHTHTHTFVYSHWHGKWYT